MTYRNTITVLAAITALAAALAAAVGIFSGGGPGPYEFESIRGLTVEIFGKGIYRHMSAEVAPQGIAQDYVTLFLGIPLLLLSVWGMLRGSLKSRLILGGVFGYFLVTYLFYLMMAKYNALFLVYCLLLGTSFFGLALTLIGVDLKQLCDHFSDQTPTAFTGGFLIFNSVMIALLWLSITVPPLLDGSIVPAETEHYTTLVVQGLDLGLLLPLGMVAGVMFVRRRPAGYLLAPVYFIFLSLLMIALSAKIVAMGILGYSIIPAVFIIPLFTAASLLCSWFILKEMHPQNTSIPENTG